MARKDVLKGLMSGADPGPAPSAPPAPQPRAERGAIGAVSRSIADLKARSVIEIDPTRIEAGGLSDRIETDEATDAQLRQSIAEHGQQVPVLVRPHPEQDGLFQIVYGRRRVLALRDLGLPVKAMVRDLSDQELVLAQGQENTARRDLSFVEKVNFARQLRDHGYDRKIICDALSVDKTMVSRMLSLADRLPVDLITAIGAAPSVGRDRWVGLADLFDKTHADLPELRSMINLNASGPGSDARFQAAWDYLTRLVETPRRPKRPRAVKTPIRSETGRTIGDSRMDDSHFTLRLKRAQTAGFETWLLTALPRLHADWLARKADDEETQQ